MDQAEELSLIKQAQMGGREAMALLWDGLTPKLFGYLVNTLRDKTLAEDILQNTWLKAITALPNFKPRGYGLSAWLFAIARNECRQHWRKGKQETALEDGDDFGNVDDHRAFESNLLIDKVLIQLPEDDREILRLRYISDLPINEAAKILKISGINARVRLHRAIKKAKNIASLWA